MDNTAAYAVADARQRLEARESAEALFARKSSPKEHFNGDMPSQETVRKPRVLSAAIPAVERVQPGAEERPAQTPKKKPRALRAVKHSGGKPQLSAGPKVGIPNSDLARVRAWIKYGMTLDDIAGMYGITAGDLRRTLQEN